MQRSDATSQQRIVTTLHFYLITSLVRAALALHITQASTSYCDVHCVMHWYCSGNDSLRDRTP
jgi:hypothetical protein